MRHISTWIAWGAVALTVAFSSLNWATLTAVAPLNLLVAEVQAPLGVVLLGLAAVLVGLFSLAYLRSQLASMLETRKLLKEVQRVQGLADTAEASRIESLRQLMTSEFQRLDQRLAAVGTRSAHRDLEIQ